ncbi:MAG: beta-ketoacyl-ACP synthase II [Elusimicrobia bacterium]|nr:beta-ketoacyl-ACP synthase II [Elusimicrobiota bacterium]
MSNRAVITGVGIIAPNGIGKDRYWKAITSGESGIKKISSFDTSQYPTKIAGEVSDFNPANYMEKRKSKMLSRFTQFALVATKMAIEDSALKPENEDPYRMGISFGNTLGGEEIDEEQHIVFHEKGWENLDPFSSARASNNYAVGVIASELKIKGPNITISTGCTSALSAIAYALDLIKSGKTDIVIAGGSEAPLVPFAFNAFCAAGVLSRRNEKPEKVSRPFEKNRDGYVLAEGCGILIIESLEHALKRNADIYAEVASYGVTNDGFSMLRMEPMGNEVAKAIELALKSGNLEAGDIDYINAHGSSSPLSDKRETNAIKLSLGEHAYKTPISSIKSMVGQPLAATGGIQAITTALAIKNRCIPPTINYEEEDPDCDLNYTPNKSQTCEIDAALINGFGLGGNNISMILKKYDSIPESVPRNIVTDFKVEIPQSYSNFQNAQSR